MSWDVQLHIVSYVPLVYNGEQETERLAIKLVRPSPHKFVVLLPLDGAQALSGGAESSWTNTVGVSPPPRAQYSPPQEWRQALIVMSGIPPPPLSYRTPSLRIPSLQAPGSDSEATLTGHGEGASLTGPRKRQRHRTSRGARGADKRKGDAAAASSTPDAPVEEGAGGDTHTSIASEDH